MKKINIVYWIFTVLFAVMMATSAIPDVIMQPEAVKFITHLGYPLYFVAFIGWAKILGAAAIIIPGFPRIKEWAYAGLFFDLIGAVYSAIAVGPVDPSLLFMAVFFIPGILSYVYYHKRKAALANSSLR